MEIDGLRRIVDVRNSRDSGRGAAATSGFKFGPVLLGGF